MKNNEVLDSFLNGSTKGHNSAKNLRIEGTTLYNYSTPIAKYYKYGFIILNNDTYSRTTSKHQNYIRARADILNVDEATMREIVNCDKETIAEKLKIDL